jgi:nucleoside 2-deoxyribosyltransferase
VVDRKRNKIYIICPVRRLTDEQSVEIEQYVKNLEDIGFEVHFPPRDVDQVDPIGFRICSEHAEAMRDCDRVDIFWDSNSTGSHFDLGMAFALNKPVMLLKLYAPDTEGKSFVKVIQKWEKQ